MGAVASTRKAWSVDEVRTVARYWPTHGSQWDGWAEVLPGRTRAAIDRKARETHLRRAGTPEPMLGETVMGCPFCGQPPKVTERRDLPGGRPRWFVACDNAACYANACAIATRREVALAHWNLRRGA